ncbi:G-protein coupled receptor 61 [Lates japonicus]|uniref:G-protein coupled receptor 61 n=1 Tax=Lates japonicus TaxID=270547 RepID=A0AAD3M1S8_LATJO|nr:G-protein coupled receptor 61 [Lates japonicus]
MAASLKTGARTTLREDLQAEEGCSGSSGSGRPVPLLLAAMATFHLYSAWCLPLPPQLAQLEDVVTWIGYFCFTSNPFFLACLDQPD